MKKLVIVRHAKSSWASEALSDFERPLNARGKRAAPIVAKHLSEVLGLQLDYVVTSPAKRAISTAHILGPVLGVATADVISNPAIYEASLTPLVYTIHEIPKSSQCAMLVGHMPGVAELAHFLLGKDAIDHFPTCGVAVLELQIEHWSEASAGCARLIDFIRPRTLEE